MDKGENGEDEIFGVGGIEPVAGFFGFSISFFSLFSTHPVTHFHFFPFLRLFLSDYHTTYPSPAG